VPEQSSLAGKIIRGMFVVLFFWLFWKFGGFLLTIIIGNLYPPGKEPAADAYSHVYKYIVFTFIYSSALKLLIPAFMPVFIERMKQHGEEKAWEFAYSVINIMLIFTIGVSAAGVFAAPYIIDILVPGFSPETQALCTRLLRIMLPGCVGMVLSMVMMSLLNSYKIFSYPSAGDAAQKLVWAAALFLGVKFLHLDARTVAYGFLAGCVVQVLINCFGLRRKRHLYRPLITDPRFPIFARELTLVALIGGLFAEIALIVHTAERLLGFELLVARTFYSGIPELDIEKWTRMIVFSTGLLLGCLYSGLLWLRARRSSTAAGRFAALLAPLLIGVLFARYRDVVTSMFQSFTQAGVFADVEFSKNIGNFPIVLVAYGLSVAMFPYLCELASGKDLKTFGDLVTRALRMIAIFFIPLSIAMVLLSDRIVALIYDRGNWSQMHVGIAGTALAIYVSALFFYAIENVVMQSYFSVQRMWKPTFLGIIASLVQVVFLVVSIGVLRLNHPQDIFLAVAVAYPLSRIFKNVALLALLRLHVPILPLRETAGFAVKLAATCAAFGFAVYGVRTVLDGLLPLRDFKRHDVVLDTFNAENTRWSSRDADALTVERGPGRRAALAVTYRPLAGREVTIDQDLSRFLLDDVSAVSFTCKASRRQPLIVEIEFDGGVWRSEPVAVGTAWPAGPYAVSVPAGMGRARRISLAIPCDQSLERGLLSPRRDIPARVLLLSELRMTSGGRQIIADSYAQPSPEWQAGEGIARVSATDGPNGNEQALLLVHEERPIALTRSLAGYDLRTAAALAFKMKSPQPGTLTVTLADRSGGLHTAAVPIRAGEERKGYTVPLSDFSPPVAPSELSEIRFAFAGADGALPENVWLDNVTFAAPRGLLRGISPTYEIVKLVHVMVPCVVGGIVLIGLVFVLRIQEGRLVLDWVTRQVRARLGKRSGVASASG